MRKKKDAMTLNCAFCAFAAPFVTKPAEYIIDGISVCEDHVDAVSGQGFGRDLRDETGVGGS